MGKWERSNKRGHETTLHARSQSIIEARQLFGLAWRLLELRQTSSEAPEWPWTGDLPGLAQHFKTIRRLGQLIAFTVRKHEAREDAGEDLSNLRACVQGIIADVSVRMFKDP